MADILIIYFAALCISALIIGGLIISGEFVGFPCALGKYLFFIGNGKIEYVRFAGLVLVNNEDLVEESCFIFIDTNNVDFFVPCKNAIKYLFKSEKTAQRRLARMIEKGE